MANENAIAHLETIRQDVRDEIKRRIEQRDKYSIQLSIALGAIVAVAFSTTGLRMVLIAAPLVSIYFTVLILYSYRIHSFLAGYLRDKIEPALAQRCGTSLDTELETYYHKQNEIPGIRQGFFLVALWVISILSLAYLWGAEAENIGATTLIVATAVYGVADLYVTCFYQKGQRNTPRNKGKMEKK